MTCALAFPDDPNSLIEQANHLLNNNEYLVLSETDQKAQETVYTILKKSDSSVEKHCFTTLSDREVYIRDNLSGWALINESNFY